MNFLTKGSRNWASPKFCFRQRVQDPGEPREPALHSHHSVLDRGFKTLEHPENQLYYLILDNLSINFLTTAPRNWASPKFCFRQGVQDPRAPGESALHSHHSQVNGIL